jgi:flagellin-like protein
LFIQKGGIKEGMKSFRKSVKALSPVVASIILIAVTVAVSIAVAAWMGVLSIGFMGTEELKITSVSFDDTTNTIALTCNNTGTASVVINEFWVNNVKQTYTAQPVAANSGVVANVTVAAGVTSGYNYQMKLVTAKGNSFMYTAVCP